MGPRGRAGDLLSVSIEHGAFIDLLGTAQVRAEDSAAAAQAHRRARAHLPRSFRYTPRAFGSLRSSR